MLKDKRNRRDRSGIETLRYKDTIMFETLKARYSAWNRYNRTVAELQALSARELEDVGIAPWQIKSVAARAVR